MWDYVHVPKCIIMNVSTQQFNPKDPIAEHCVALQVRSGVVCVATRVCLAWLVVGKQHSVHQNNDVSPTNSSCDIMLFIV